MPIENDESTRLTPIGELVEDHPGRAASCLCLCVFE